MAWARAYSLSIEGWEMKSAALSGDASDAPAAAGVTPNEFQRTSMTQCMFNTLRGLLPGPILLGIILLPSGTPGQGLDEDFYELPAFVVETAGDRGYLSTNAVSGTSLNMPIRDLPMPLEVINQELIEDLQANNMKEALAYSAGVFTQSFQSGSGANEAGPRERSPSTAANVNNPFTNTLSIRGYAVPNQQRFGFRVGSIAVGEGFTTVLGGITDTSNVQRMEVVRGPASLLYGVNVLSGVVNILPKEPLMTPRFQSRVTVGSYDYYRASAEFTGPIIKDKLAFRLLGTFQDSGHWTDFRKNELEYYVGQIKWHPLPRTEILAELQYSDQTQRAIGPQFFSDGLVGQEIFRNPRNRIDFRNGYYEHIRFGHDLPDSFMTRNPEDPNDIWLIRKDDPLVPQENARLGDNYRISGPDTYFNRRELNALLLVRSTPFRNFNTEFGAYYTKVEQEEFNVAMNLFTNSEGPISTQPNQAAPDALGRGGSLWVRNPEVLQLFGGVLPDPVGTPLNRFYPIDQAVGFRVAAGDVPNFVIPNAELHRVTSGGIGEVFIVPDLPERLRPGGDPMANNWNNKIARYYWVSRPTSSESYQLRARGAYSFEADLPAWLGGASRHIVTGGLQFIQDEMSIVSGGAAPSNTVTYTNLDGDPYRLRDSVFDYSPIRYEGETPAIPGNLNFTRETLGDPLFDYGLRNGFRVARSGWRDVTAYYRGAYAVYQGHFMQERITFIGGLRHDAYQIRESEYLRVLDGDPNIDPARNTTVTDVYQGTGIRVGSADEAFSLTPYLAGTGDRPYTRDQWIAGVPDVLNEEVARQIDLLREGLGPNGTSRTLFPESQTFNTKTAGINLRITDPLSAYILYSEGVFPNQGQRDGLDRPIPAERTRSKEIGLKFDLFDQRISGTISLFQLRRDNATWDFPAAPSPRRWIGGRLGNPVEDYQPWSIGTPTRFDARSYLHGDGVEFDIANVSPERYQRKSYAVIDDFVRDVWREQTGTELPPEMNQAAWNARGFDFVYSAGWPIPGNPQFENRNRAAGGATFVWADVERDFVPGKHVNEDGIDLGMLMKEAFDRAMAATDFDGFPIGWTQNETPIRAGVGNNPSNRTGDLVTFSEEALGIDGQIIISPIPNYQIITTFSHQRRKVVGGGFDFVPLIDPISGETVPGTPYDRWIYVLGKDAFDDPTDPTTHNGLGVDGLDLSFVPKWNFSLWNKYTVTEGALEGVEFLGGVRYFGKAPTSIAIGAGAASDNRYPTPPTKERFVFDLGINYGFSWSRTDWRIGLKVDNVLNDRVSENVVTYEDINDPSITHTRRSRVVYAPRTWRLSVSVTY